MSINWVMLSETEQFTPLPGEQTLYTSPQRTTLTIQTMSSYPGKDPFSLQSSAGTVHLTNRRIVYLPASPTSQLQSFAAPLLNVQDAHVHTPWFGANTWNGIVQPVAGGGLPPQHSVLELKMTFKEGGAFDFNTIFERIKERLQQAVEVARESGMMSGDGTETGRGLGEGALAGVNMDSVHLDELPAYDAASTNATSPVAARPSTTESTDTQMSPSLPTLTTTTSRPNETPSIPLDPPPGYEEVQRDSVADELERRLRQI